MIRRFLSVLFWETLQNMPMILGFLVAARLWPNRPVLALIILLVGIVSGCVLMHFTEWKLHPGRYQSTLKGVIVNIVVFTVLAVPFLFYFSADAWWSAWWTDLVLGVLIGILMTIGQATAWQGPKSRMVLHGLAMAAACPLIMLSVRYILMIRRWPVMVLVGALMVLLASIVIALIDYRNMYAGGQKAT